MSWLGLEGHDELVENFRRALSRGRLATTYLFVGPPGVGKHSFARRFAQCLLCQTRPPELLDPCGACPGCLQVQAGTHPDLIEIRKPDDKAEIPVALLIGSKEKRMQEGLCHAISLKPFMGGRRVAILDDADLLNEEGANCLLKTLEEPPPHSVLILIGTSIDRQLPTMRSRAQIIRFAAIDTPTLERLILQYQLTADAALAHRLALASGGSLVHAAELAEPELWEFRTTLLAQLSKNPLPSFELARAMQEFVDAVSKDAAPRRARLRRVIGFAADFYKQLMVELVGGPSAEDPELADAVAKAREFISDWEAAATALERSLEALAHIDRNANTATLIECWTDDLAQIAAGQPI